MAVCAVLALELALESENGNEKGRGSGEASEEGQAYQELMIQTMSNFIQLFACSSPKNYPQLSFLDQLELLKKNTRTWHANGSMSV